MGLVELLAALMILNIAILAIIASFSSGMLALRNAGQKATAATLADAQMELYRAIKFEAIGLDAGTIPGAGTYTTDGAYSLSQVTLDPCTEALACSASRTASGATAPASPDGRAYQIDTYIVSGKPENAGVEITGSCNVKRVTIVVRDPEDSRVLTRQSSTFDRSTGLSPGETLGCP